MAKRNPNRSVGTTSISIEENLLMTMRHAAVSENLSLSRWLERVAKCYLDEISG
jgi:hypothetical protein